VYTWGILLTYIHRRLSSRLRFHVFWKVGRDILIDSTSQFFLVEKFTKIRML